MCKIYTFGYQGQSVATLQEQVKQLNGVVVDIRYSPYSHNIIWNQKQLQSVLQDKYVYIHELGNVNYKEKNSIKILNMDVGLLKIGSLLNKGFNPILLCVCKNISFCHRLIVGQHLVYKFGGELIHLPKTEQKFTQISLL